jgi:hypothetical protein
VEHGPILLKEPRRGPEVTESPDETRIKANLPPLKNAGPRGGC